jgi:hypothetical protein
LARAKLVNSEDLVWLVVFERVLKYTLGYPAERMRARSGRRATLASMLISSVEGPRSARAVGMIPRRTWALAGGNTLACEVSGADRNTRTHSSRPSCSRGVVEDAIVNGLGQDSVVAGAAENNNFDM